MNFEGTVNIKAPRKMVWEFLTDPHLVSKCAPGLESLDIVTPDKEFKVVASIGLGSVKVRFANDVEFVERDELERAKIKVHGTAPGSSMDAVSEMILADGPDGSTDMQWAAEIVVMGKIASLASRLMGSVTKKLTGEFFNCVKKNIEAQFAAKDNS